MIHTGLLEFGLSHSGAPFAAGQCLPGGPENAGRAAHLRLGGVPGTNELVMAMSIVYGTSNNIS